MLSAVDNIKIDACIFCKIKRCQVVKLRIEDIDNEWMVAHVKVSKGLKDRYTVLFKKTLEVLRECLKEHRSQMWSFLGQRNDKYTTTRTVEKFLSSACSKARITKKVTVHALQHCLADHLHKRGVDLRYIQELLGHKSTKTTDIYAHVGTRDISKIKSQLDNIDVAVVKKMKEKLLREINMGSTRGRYIGTLIAYPKSVFVSDLLRI